MSLFELVGNAMPENIDGQTLKSFCPPDWWQDREEAALAYALHKMPALDWDAYIANNDEVKESGVDPVWHFLKHGVFRNLKLYAHSNAEKAHYRSADVLRPTITIALVAPEDGPHLHRSLASINSQSCMELEIIVAFYGESPKNLYQDSRIRVLGGFANATQARKAATHAATGKYMIFMQAGDYLYENACARLEAEISRGYDLVSFRINGALGQYTTEGSKAATKVEEKYAVFAREIIGGTLKNVICETSLCQRVFASLPGEGRENLWPVYENALLRTASSNVTELQEQLLFSPDTEIPVGDLVKELPALQSYMESSGYNECFPALKKEILTLAINAWLEERNADQVTPQFDALAESAGIYNVLERFIELYPQGWERIANQFGHYTHGYKKPARIATIGILYNRLVNGGAERVIIHLANLLVQHGYGVRLFLERPYENERELPKEAEVIYVGRCAGQPADLRAHLEALGNALKAAPVEVMLCHACYDGNLLWHTMLLRYLGIPSVMFPHSAFFRRLLHPENPFSIQCLGAILRCVDKVSVLSIYEELYYRTIGVNAQYTPNPVRLPMPGEKFPPYENRTDNIIVFSRLGDPVKNVEDCLRALREIVRARPRVRMTFVGSFAEGWGRERFEKLADSLGVKSNIHITGWVHDARPFIDRACLLISCAYHEAFPLTVAESQGRGLPCIMYDLPVMAARNNPSLFRVKHGKWRQMARLAIEIMADAKRWRELSEIAKANAANYSGENYIRRVIQLLEDFQVQSTLTEYDPEDYNVIIRALGFYGTHLPPWRK